MLFLLFSPFLLDVLCPLISLKMALLWARDWTSDLQKSLSTKIFKWSSDYLIFTTLFAFWPKLLQDFSSTKIFSSFTIVYESTPKWIYSSLTLYYDLYLPSPFYVFLCSLFFCFVFFFNLHHFLVPILHTLCLRASWTKPQEQRSFKWQFISRSSIARYHVL